jgi:hypothetical protein
VAIDLADMAAPDLGLAQPDLAMAIHTGDLGQHSRAGVAVMRHHRHLGQPVRDRALYLLTGGVISAREWAAVGAWVMDPNGAGASLPVMVSAASAIDVPASVAPWRWQPLRVPAHPRGGRVTVTGNGWVDKPWAEGGVELRALAATVGEPCTLNAESGGPLGPWEIASAQGFGQVFGARGVRFEFEASGALRVVLADAFVGPLAALAMAEEVGTSGVANATWKVAGRFQLEFDGVAAHNLTMHSRSGDGFLMPAGSFGVGEWLQALEDATWAWQATEERLVMRGRMMGGAVEVRLKRA